MVEWVELCPQASCSNVFVNGGDDPLLSTLLSRVVRISGRTSQSGADRGFSGRHWRHKNPFPGFLSFLIIAVSWNWIYNIVSLLLGSRLTCNKLDEEGKPCGARVQRKKAVQKKTGQKVAQYVCANGHKRPDAHFHPIRKGMVSHTVWLVALTFCVVVFLLS